MISLERLQRKNIDQDQSEDPPHRPASHPTIPFTTVTSATSACTRAVSDRLFSPSLIPNLAAAEAESAITSLVYGEHESIPRDHTNTTKLPPAPDHPQPILPNDGANSRTKRKRAACYVTLDPDDQPDLGALDNEVHLNTSTAHRVCPWGILYRQNPGIKEYEAFSRCASVCEISRVGKTKKQHDFVIKHIVEEHFLWGDFSVLGLTEDLCYQSLKAFRSHDGRYKSQNNIVLPSTKYETVVKLLFGSQIAQDSTMCSFRDRPHVRPEPRNRSRDNERIEKFRKMKERISHSFVEGIGVLPGQSFSIHNGPDENIGAGSTQYPLPWSSMTPNGVFLPHADTPYGSGSGQELRQHTSKMHESPDQNIRKTKITKSRNDPVEYELNHAGTLNHKHVALLKDVDQIIPPSLASASATSPQPSPDNQSLPQSSSDLQGTLSLTELLERKLDNLEEHYNEWLRAQAH